METTVDISQIIPIIKEAHRVIMEVYNSDDFSIEIKGDNSPLTKADKLASDVICSSLKNLYPDIPIICEETKLMDYSERKGWSTFFLIDPVDGTKEFIKRNGEFTVNIGLIDNGEPVLGAVGIPCQNVIYYAQKGFGSWKLNLNDGYESRLVCTPFSRDDQVNVVCSRSHMNKETEEFLESWNVGEMVPSGSSIKFLLICDNKAQIYPRLGLTSEWDIAASHAILSQAGGRIEQLDGSKIEYNKECLLNPFFVAYGKMV